MNIFIATPSKFLVISFEEIIQIITQLATSGDGYRQDWGTVEEGEELTFTSYAFVFISFTENKHAFLL